MSAELRYLKIDLSTVDAFGKAVWLFSIHAARGATVIREEQGAAEGIGSVNAVISGRCLT